MADDGFQDLAQRAHFISERDEQPTFSFVMGAVR
ncbi:hypothetical protein FHT71_004814 [Rhizobium sp. BK060]|nr:hypothetical protein [Rhizobium sp. BK060]